MSKDEIKSIKVDLTKEVWKRLKILSVQKDISLQELIKDILEKSIKKVNVEEIVINN